MLADSFNHWASGEAYVVCCVPKVQTDQGPYLSLKFSSEPISCQQLGKLFPLSPFQNGALPPSAQLPAQALMFVLVIAGSLFIHIQTSEAVQKGPPTSERPGKEVTGRTQGCAAACPHCQLGFSLPSARSCSNSLSNSQSQGCFLFSWVQRVPTLVPRKSKESTASPSRPSL